MFIRHKVQDLILRTQKWKWGREQGREGDVKGRGREKGDIFRAYKYKFECLRTKQWKTKSRDNYYAFLWGKESREASMDFMSRPCWLDLTVETGKYFMYL